MGEARKLDPAAIALPERYQIEVFAAGLNAPINLVQTDAGDLLAADAGITDGNGKVLQYAQGGFQVIADGFKPPLTGISFYQGNIYVSHRGFVTVVKPGGEKRDILAGLPSNGDHHNNQVIFGPDGKMYFGQGTATNSGVVGEDNDWVKQHPFFHDYPGAAVRLAGRNFASANVLSPSAKEEVMTGAYGPFGVPSEPGETIKGIAAASGSILRADPDGSQLELVAWGLRNPFRLKFDRSHRLFAANHGMDERGGRPVAHSPDEFQLIQPGAWYGWPDYSGGYPVTMPWFKPDKQPQPEFLLAGHPMRPPKPVAVFAPHSAAMGFDFNYDSDFGPVGHVFIAEFGSGAPRTTGGKADPQVGHRVSRLDPVTGEIRPFAVNRSGLAATDTGEGGFERPIDVLFANGSMFVLDMGLRSASGGLVPNTGVIWRITASR